MGKLHRWSVNQTPDQSDRELYSLLYKKKPA